MFSAVKLEAQYIFSREFLVGQISNLGRLMTRLWIYIMSILSYTEVNFNHLPSWNWINFLRMAAEIPRQILLFSCLGMTPTLPCFSFVFTRHPKEFDMTYYIHTIKQRVFSPFVMILSHAYTFSIKPLFVNKVLKGK
jgi:hypothetical protein